MLLRALSVWHMIMKSKMLHNSNPAKKQEASKICFKKVLEYLQYPKEPVLVIFMGVKCWFLVLFNS